MAMALASTLLNIAMMHSGKTDMTQRITILAVITRGLRMVLLEQLVGVASVTAESIPGAEVAAGVRTIMSTCTELVDRMVIKIMITPTDAIITAMILEVHLAIQAILATIGVEDEEVEVTLGSRHRTGMTVGAIVIDADTS
jgi:hypothetical protein